MVGDTDVDGERREFEQVAGQLYDELRAWRARHPEATLDEIVQQAVPRRQRLMGLLLEQLACQHGRGEVAEGLACEQCGRPLEYKGRQRRQVEHIEAAVELTRAYYYCPHCESGLFPPGPSAATDEA